MNEVLLSTVVTVCIRLMLLTACIWCCERIGVLVFNHLCYAAIEHHVYDCSKKVLVINKLNAENPSFE